MTIERPMFPPRRATLVAAIGSPCPYCGQPMAFPSRDHLHPRSRGGALTDIHNRVIACARCNADKGSLSIRRWLIRLAATCDVRAAVVAKFISGRG
jgi:5-methylcytosine-specific restriction endonuclease McrA